jgi:CHAT domain-containing protein/uncharacterized protein HemY
VEVVREKSKTEERRRHSAGGRALTPNISACFLFSFGLFFALLQLVSEPASASDAGLGSNSARGGSPRSTQVEKDIQALQPDKPVERDLAGGQTHRYLLALAAGQYLHLIVEQLGVDVVVRVTGPDGKYLAETDCPNNTQGPEPVDLLAGHAGTYQFEVRALENDAPSGRYRIRIAEVRPSTPQDASRIAAQAAFAEATKLRERGTAESRKTAVQKYEEALALKRLTGDRWGEAMTLYSLGLVWDDLREQKKALDYYEQALALNRTLADSVSEAETLDTIGDLYRSMKDFQKAHEYYGRVLSLRRASGDRAGLARALSSVGQAYRESGDKQKALEVYNEAVSLRHNLGDRRGEGQTLSNMGLVYSQLGETQKALDLFAKALPLRRAAGDRGGEAITLGHIAEAYGSLGEKRKAIEYYDQLLPLRRTSGDRRGEAQTLRSIAAAYSELGERRKALEFYGEELTVRRGLKDRAGEAQALNSIAAVCRLLGNYQEALDYNNQALAIRREIDDRRGQAQTINNLGVIYRSLGDNQKALDLYTESLALRREAKDRSGEVNSLNNLGTLYRAMGEHKKALEVYTQSLALCRETNNRREAANALNNIGVVYRYLGDNQKALDYYNQSLSLHQLLRNRDGEANALSNIGKVYALMGEGEKASDYFNKSLTLLRAQGYRRGEALALTDMASFERDRGNLTQARTHIEAALNLVESMRATVASPELRALYLASERESYEFYTNLLVRLHRRNPGEGYDAIALAASERGRARSLLEMLNEASVDIRQGLEPALLERERSLQSQLNAKAESQLSLLSDEHTEEQAAAIHKELEALTSQYRDVEARIRTASPRYAALTQPSPLSLVEIRQRVLDPDTLLLEYAVGSEASYVWVVSSASIAVYDLPKRTEVEAAARRVYELLTARQPVRGESEQQRAARIAKADAEWPAATDALSKMLLGPVASQLGTRRLLIVAEGALQYVPFGALPAPDISDNRRAASDGSPLIVDHEIVSAPSASVLAVLRRDTTGRKPSDKTVAVLADPVFDKDDDRVAQASRPARDQIAKAGELHPESEVRRAVREVDLSSAGEGIPRLPFSREEAEAIVGAAPAGKGLKATGFQASRATATSAELAQYRIVHFATHSLLNNEHPELTGIVLSLVDEQGRPQDGFLRLHELYNLNLPVELVVLSACQTGLGKEVKGEGLVGLVRGFMYAGAPRVVASQWKVDDWATAELMKEFYRSMLKDGMRPAAALRAAQVAMWKQKRWQAPYYWAGFVLHGEWR